MNPERALKLIESYSKSLESEEVTPNMLRERFAVNKKFML